MEGIEIGVELVDISKGKTGRRKDFYLHFLWMVVFQPYPSPTLSNEDVFYVLLGAIFAFIISKTKEMKYDCWKILERSSESSEHPTN